MKNLLNWPRIVLLLLMATGFENQSNAQIATRDFTANVRLNEINPQAFRHFKKNYAAISNENWFKTDAGYTVKFTDHLVINQVFYDQRGNFIYGVRYLDEKDLGKEISARIHKQFPEYLIDIVSELNGDENIVYMISLRNKISVKNIMITESEVRVIDNLVYASR